MNRHNERAAASYDMPLSGNKLFVFLLVCLKTGISGCGSPFLIFLYERFRVRKKFLFARVSHDYNHEYCAMRIQERLRGCDPPEAFILHREIVLTMKASITLRAYLTTEVASIAR